MDVSLGLDACGSLGSSRMEKASTSFLIPCGCLKDQEVVPIKKSYAPQEQRKTFAQALGNTCNIPLSHFPTPGDMVDVRVEKEDYTWRVLNIARITYMGGLFYLRVINPSHTLI